MTAERTAVYREMPAGFVALVAELPGANTQGSTVNEAEPTCVRRWYS